MRAVVLGCLWLAACGAGAPAAATPNEQVEPATAGEIDLDRFVAKHAEGAVVLDVRTPAEFAAGRVPGALPVPLNELTAQHPTIQALDAKQPIYTICESGGRSGVAAKRLAAAGFEVYNVTAGTSGWRGRGLPLDKGATP